MSELPVRTRPSHFTLPNILTMSRIAVVPLIVATLYAVEGAVAHWIAFGLFLFASATDYLDGYLARAMSLQSQLGRMLDPIADKLLVGVSILMLVYDDTIAGHAIWAAAIILFREITVSGLREFLAELNVKLHVTHLAKWKTGIQMMAVGALLLGPGTTPIWGVVDITEVGLGLLWISAILTIVTGLDYLKAALRNIED
ncbi:MAG: CDP-diacylglycerol--glycerol-3-phosphate 3-phosphatidyltransferase [Pseudomonadota bacterium]